MKCNVRESDENNRLSQNWGQVPLGQQVKDCLSSQGMKGMGRCGSSSETIYNFKLSLSPIDYQEYEKTSN